jgi:hypothetical protein
LLFDYDPARLPHVVLASPGGDGETAIRMVRSMQVRCSELAMMLRSRGSIARLFEVSPLTEQGAIWYRGALAKRAGHGGPR